MGYDFGQIIGRSSSFNETKHHSYLNTLERLVERNYFQNNRKMIANSWGRSVYRIHPVICSMTNLEIFTFVDWETTPGLFPSTVYLTEEDLARVFQSCPKLTELRTRLFTRCSYESDRKLEMGEELKNEFRSGCQRLRLFEHDLQINSWPVIVEMLT